MKEFDVTGSMAVIILDKYGNIYVYTNSNSIYYKHTPYGMVITQSQILPKMKEFKSGYLYTIKHGKIVSVVKVGSIETYRVVYVNQTYQYPYWNDYYYTNYGYEQTPNQQEIETFEEMISDIFDIDGNKINIYSYGKNKLYITVSKNIDKEKLKAIKRLLSCFNVETKTTIEGAIKKKTLERKLNEIIQEISEW